MTSSRFVGFDLISTADIMTGFAVFRFGRKLSRRDHQHFMAQLQDAGMLQASSDPRSSHRARGLDPVIGLSRLFGITYQPPRNQEQRQRYVATLVELQDSCQLVGAWAHVTETCVDVSRRRSDGIVSWRHGPPPGRSQTRFPTSGLDAVRTDGHSNDRLSLNFELHEPLCPESVGILLAFCRYWLAPYGDQLAGTQGMIEPSDARCYMLGDINIEDDRKTVRFRMENLIPPGEYVDCLHHVMGVVDSVHDVMPVRRAWFNAA